MLTIESITPWAPHPSARPATAFADDTLHVSANGTRTCVGGWQIVYSGVESGQAYAISCQATWPSENSAPPLSLRDHLQCVAHWEVLPADQPRTRGPWAYLLPERIAPDRIRFANILVAPPDAMQLTIRYTFRWATEGAATWSLPEIVATGPSPVATKTRPPVKIAVVTGGHWDRQGPHTVAGNTAFYHQLCLAACQEAPDLILLPEVCLQWQVPGSALDCALPLDAPEVDLFRQIARDHQLYLGLGLFERDGDAVFNTLALLGPDGEVAGRYHKVHLAVLNESDSGVLPGETFPVVETLLGRMGFNICMDSSAAESSRMVGLNGADFLLMPIMGDHRSDRWSEGRPYFNEDRWRAIMRTHAMDNQLCMVVARNEAHGSCVIDRKGDILAWNEGLADYVIATVNGVGYDADDGYRTWNSGCFREITWVQRRPHLYGAFVDENNVGSLRNQHSEP
jgi:predicted amidohydrolase